MTMTDNIIITSEEVHQFDRVLDIVTYRESGRLHIPEEAKAILVKLAAGFQRVKAHVQSRHPQPDGVEAMSVEEAYTNLMYEICEYKTGLLLEYAVITWVLIIAEKPEEKGK